MNIFSLSLSLSMDFFSFSLLFIQSVVEDTTDNLIFPSHPTPFEKYPEIPNSELI